jgi:hypothetical protein
MRARTAQWDRRNDVVVFPVIVTTDVVSCQVTTDVNRVVKYLCLMEMHNKVYC